MNQSRSTMSSAALRARFLDFFRERGHEIVPSSSLVPANDPTLLFTNAGMVQFKEVFVGREQRDYSRAVSAQRCVRAGGKHNDLENVGYTARHHTFFEMLGNFSFGDYFKREAIQYAWEFVTEALALPPERLWITVFRDDDEAAAIWLEEIGIDPARFSRCDEDENFWSMGDTGPCGPCSEIFYDHGPEIAGGPPGGDEPEGDRFVEIWNLVFMQYNRDESGHLEPLPNPSVDTGMGLERVAAVVQGVHSNYEIDLFRNLMRAAAELTGSTDSKQTSLRVIADHIRSCAFLIVDGVLPANEGRGYVLRRVIRRAIRHGHKLGVTDPFFWRLVEPLVTEMGEAYPELARNQDFVERVLRQEEERFAETLDYGMKLLEQAIATLEGDTLDGETVFKLYDTYGFPVDLTADIARERNLKVDMPGFEQAMANQRDQSRAASRFEGDYGSRLVDDLESSFTGYDRLVDEAPILRILRDEEVVEELEAGAEGALVLERTPYYAESGGQVGDTGVIRTSDGIFEVHDTHKEGSAHLHFGKVKMGTLRVGARATAEVTGERRAATARNHSATHLLHAALREKLGTHVAQKGSLVAPDRLRFDFSHFEPLTAEELRAIEERVNQEIRAATSVTAEIMPIKEAMEQGAMALFGEKYGDVVRVLKMGTDNYSIELCGGTHVQNLADIGVFRIVNETGVAAGIRRVEAITGEAAMARLLARDRALESLAGTLKVAPEEVSERVDRLLEEQRRLEKELERLKQKLASQSGSDLAAQAEEIAGTRVIAARVDGTDAKAMRDMVDQLKQKTGSCAVVLGAADGGKVRLVAGVSADRTDRIPAGELVNHVAQQVGGRGGGRADMAQAGGSEPGHLDEALASVGPWVREQLGE